MLPITQATLHKVYRIEALQLRETEKKHLNDLGLIVGTEIALINKSGENGVLLLHNTRIAVNQSLLNKIIVDDERKGLKEWVSLDQLAVGQQAVVVGIHGQGAIRRRLMDMGITKDVNLLIRKMAPLGDPIEINLRGYELTLRKSEAELVLVEKVG